MNNSILALDVFPHRTTKAGAAASGAGNLQFSQHPGVRLSWFLPGVTLQTLLTLSWPTRAELYRSRSGGP
jgi:hypothetical protein